MAVFDCAILKVSAAILMVLAFVSPTHAKIIKYNCTYPLVANPNGIARNQDLKMTFAIDDATGKATLIGDAGTTDVILISGSAGLTFVERQNSGAIQTTTLDTSGRSVHSRHLMIGGTLVPSQSYGKCVNE